MPIRYGAATASTKRLSTMSDATTAPLIGEATAEKIKRDRVCLSGNEVREIEGKGRNLAEGIPRSFTLNSKRDSGGFAGTAVGNCRRCQNGTEQTPPELGAMLLNGNCPHRRRCVAAGWLTDWKRTGLPVLIAEDPLTCVARGGGRALEMLDERGDELLFSID